MKAKRQAAEPPVVRRTVAERATTRMRPWLQFGLVILLVARPLIPSEGVAWLGDGQPFNLLTIVLAAAFCLLAVLEGGFARMNLVDAAVGVLVVLCVASALAGAQAGDPRMSLNMLWEWVALGLVYFLVRQLFREAGDARALVAVMIALAAVMAGYGFYQVFVSLPADRAAYAASPDAVLRAMGQWYPPDSPERLQFENRLQSTEPLGTFALANSLAGFLAPWLVMALAICWSELAGDPRAAGHTGPRTSVSRAALVCFALCLGAVAVCLLLTKSRSAYLAVSVGVVLLLWRESRARRMVLNRRFALVAAAVLLVVVVAGLVWGGLDAKVLSEAGKSFAYRLEYWRATLAMIARNPWLGVGPGNFQDYYTQFKLPQASEEIQDPHNFLLEVWATCGTFALFVLCDVLGAFARRTWQMDDRAAAAPAAPADISARTPAFIVAGGAAGFAMALLIAPSVGMSFSDGLLLSGWVVFGAVIALLWPWIVGGRLPTRAAALGVLVLSINLLAAGGITYPGVAGSLWVLLALGLNEIDRRGADAAPVRFRRLAVWAPAVGLALACAALLGCYFIAYRPVLRYVRAMALANEDGLTVDDRVNRLLEAAAADPISAEPWAMIAELELPRLKADPTAEGSRNRFVIAARKILELRPQTSSAWRQVGRWHYDLYLVHPSSGTGKVASVDYQRAVALYPNLAPLRAEYALVLHAVGESAAARQQIAVARELDRQTSHADKQLSPETRGQLEAIEEQLR